MAAESQQDWVGRNRPPRVQIKYQVFNSGVPEQKELPLKVGVLADLSGQPETALPPLAERRFTAVSRDNFNAFLKGCKPRLAVQVDNLVEDDGTTIPVTLEFESIKDFEPDRIADQVEPLRKLLELRDRLKSAMDQVSESPQLKRDLRSLLAKVLAEPGAGTKDREAQS
jgi:type VI secretion system protein ImpB